MGNDTTRGLYFGDKFMPQKPEQQSMLQRHEGQPPLTRRTYYSRVVRPGEGAGRFQAGTVRLRSPPAPEGAPLLARSDRPRHAHGPGVTFTRSYVCRSTATKKKVWFVDGVLLQRRWVLPGVLLPRVPVLSCGWK